jgi:hypothetical protein
MAPEEDLLCASLTIVAPAWAASASEAAGPFREPREVPASHPVGQVTLINRSVWKRGFSEDGPNAKGSLAPCQQVVTMVP